MKFAPCPWRHDNLRGWSPQRIAAARRAVTKEAARIAALRDQVALFPELQAEIQPDFTTKEERMTAMDRRELHFTITFRKERAKRWRDARSQYFRLSLRRREGLRRLWNLEIYPLDPTYLSTLIGTFARPGHSPWTYLRKRALVRNYSAGRMPRPSNFLDLTRHWDRL